MYILARLSMQMYQFVMSTIRTQWVCCFYFICVHDYLQGRIISPEDCMVFVHLTITVVILGII